MLLHPALSAHVPDPLLHLRVRELEPLGAIDGRQQLDWREFLRPAQLGIVIAVGIFWWAHRFIGTAGAMVRNSALESLLG